MSAITKIIEKATLIDLYEVLAGQTQSEIHIIRDQKGGNAQFNCKTIPNSGAFL